MEKFLIAIYLIFYIGCSSQEGGDPLIWNDIKQDRPCEEDSSDKEKVDNGGPWEVNLSGDINEDIKFVDIYCQEEHLADENIELFISFHNNGISALTKPKDLQISVKTDSIVLGKSFDNVFASFRENETRIFSAQSFHNNNTQINFRVTKYKKNTVLEGVVSIAGYLENIDTSEKIDIDTGEIAFICNEVN